MHLELSPPGVLEPTRIVDNDVPLFHNCTMIRVIVAITVTVSKDLAVTIKR